MSKHIAYGGVVVAAALALSGLGAGGAGASATAARAGQPAGQAVLTAGAAGTVPGMQLWVRRFNGPANSYDRASSVAVSPGGGTVYVTGTSASRHTGYDFATVAYNTATGALRWVHRYNGPTNDTDKPTSMAVSPSGSTVFVTGLSYMDRDCDYATVAYDAATGAQLWVHRNTGPAYGDDDATSSVAVSPSGGMVFVTGDSSGSASLSNYTTIAYNAATGAQRWATRYNGSPGQDDQAFSLAVSPGGSTVYVTGSSDGNSSRDYATVAYNAATGAQLWAARYNGPGDPEDNARSVTVGPGGGMLFVTGDSGGDYATLAYDAATGAQLWVHRYNGPANGYDGAWSVAVSPSGGTVYVTGSSDAPNGQPNYATVAYNAATGAQLWVHRYNGPANSYDSASSVAVSPGGGTVYVTGTSASRHTGPDFATIAYSG